MSSITKAATRPPELNGASENLDLSFLILRAFYDLRGTLERMIQECGLDKWIRPGMGPILYALYEGDDCTISDIAGRVQLSAPTLTNTLKRMQADGLVELRRCRDDGRAMRVRLTRRARRLKPKMEELRNRVRKVVHCGMNEEQVQQTKRRLIQMIEAMEVYAWEASDPRK